MDAEVRELLERGVTALEKLSDDPVIHMETGPAVCPHCDKVNPVVRAEESDGTGLMAEIVYRMQCMNCSNVFYGVPLQWSTMTSLDQAADVIQERAEVAGYGNTRNN